MSEVLSAILFGLLVMVACDMNHACEKNDNAALCAGKYSKKFMNEFNKGFQPVGEK